MHKMLSLMEPKLLVTESLNKSMSALASTDSTKNVLCVSVASTI